MFSSTTGQSSSGHWRTCAAVSIAVFAAILAACGETKKLNKTYTNNKGGARRYLIVQYKIYGGGSLAPYIPATCFTGANAPPTPGGCPTGHVPGPNGTYYMYWDLGAAGVPNGTKIHVGCDFQKVGNNPKTATYPIDFEEVSWDFSNTVPTPPGSGVGGASSSAPSRPNPALVVNVHMSPNHTFAVISVSPSAPGNIWLQKLEVAASSIDVPINNVLWGDPLFDSLPWQTPTSNPNEPGSKLLFVPMSPSDLSQAFVYVRYQASTSSPSSPPDQLSAVQYPMPR
jgi:hypothetical protein